MENEVNNTYDEQKDISENRPKTIFAYIFWLVLIPVFAAKDSKFARFHANQGLVLAILESAIIITFGLLSLIPYVGWLFSVLEYLALCGCTVLAVFGIIAVARGQFKELPILSQFKILK